MDLFLDYPRISLFVLAIILVVLVKVLRKTRLASGRTECGRCGTAHPRQAKYCRVCGEPLGADAPRT